MSDDFIVRAKIDVGDTKAQFAQLGKELQSALGKGSAGNNTFQPLTQGANSAIQSLKNVNSALNSARSSVFNYESAIKRASQVQLTLKQRLSEGKITADQYAKSVSNLTNKINQQNSASSKFKPPKTTVATPSIGNLSGLGNMQGVFGSISAGLGRMGGVAVSATSGMSGLVGVMAGAGGIITAVAVAVGAVVGGLVALGGKSLETAKSFEENVYSIGALMNATMNFKDASGKALDPSKPEAFKQALNLTSDTLDILKKRADLLSGVEFSDFVTGLKTAQPYMAKLGANTAEAKAKLTEYVVTAMKTLKPQAHEAELAFEIRASLSGDFGNTKSELGRFIQSTMGAKQAKLQFDQAVKNGTAMDFYDKALGRLIKSVENASNTLVNLEQVLKGGIDRAFRQIGMEMLNAQKDITRLKSDAIDKASDGGAFKRIGTDFASMLSTIKPLIAPVMEWSIQMIEAFTKIGAIVMNIMSPLMQVGALIMKATAPLGELALAFFDMTKSASEAFSSGFSAMVTGIGKLLEPLTNAFRPMLDGAMQAWNDIFAGAKAMFEGMTVIFKGLTEDWDGTMAFLEESWRYVMDNLPALMQIAGGKILQATATMLDMLQRGWDALVKGVGLLISGLVKGIGKAFVWAGQAIINAIGTAFQTVTNVVKGAFEWIAGGLEKLFNGGFNEFFNNIIEGHKQAFVAVLHGIGSFFKKVWEGLKNIGNAIKDILTGKAPTSVPVDIKPEINMSSTKSIVSMVSKNIKFDPPKIDINAKIAEKKLNSITDSVDNVLDAFNQEIKPKWGDNLRDIGTAMVSQGSSNLDKEGLNAIQSKFGEMQKKYKTEAFADAVGGTAPVNGQGVNAPGADGKKTKEDKAGENQAKRDAMSAIDAKYDDLKYKNNEKIRQINDEIYKQKEAMQKLDASEYAKSSQMINLEKEASLKKAEEDKKKRDAEIQHKLKSGAITKAQAKAQFEENAKLTAQGKADIETLANTEEYNRRLFELDKQKKQAIEGITLAEKEYQKSLLTEIEPLKTTIASAKERLAWLKSHGAEQSEIINQQQIITDTEDAIKTKTQEITNGKNAQLTALNALIAQYPTLLASLQKEFGLTQSITDSREGGAIADAKKKGATATGEAKGIGDALKSAVEGFGEGLSSALEDGKITAEEMGDILMDAANKLLDAVMEMAMNAIMTGIGGGMGGGMGFKDGGYVSKFKDGGFVSHYASGGHVSGAGTSRSDSIPAMLSDGEFVSDAETTRKNGWLLEQLRRDPDYLNKMKNIKKLASGGFVSPSASISKASAPALSRTSSGSASMNSQYNINYTIHAMDSQDVTRAISNPDTMKMLGNHAVSTTQETSHRKGFQQSTYTKGRSR